MRDIKKIQEFFSRGITERIDYEEALNLRLIKVELEED